MNLTLSRNEALRHLTDLCRMPQATAVRALSIADQMGVNAESGGNRPITIRALHNGKAQYQLEDGIPVEAVGKVPQSGYTSRQERKPAINDQKAGKTMPRGRKAAAEPQVEENGARDLSVYADKEPTAKMLDYHEFLEAQLGQKLDLHSVYVGVTLYPEFQKSDFNRERTAARRAAREAEAAPEPTPAAKPTRGRAAAAKPAAAKGGTTGKRGAPKPTTAGRRGRGRQTAAAGAEAPF